MTKKIGLFAFALTLSLSLNYVGVYAVSESEIILESDVVIEPCEPDLGCYLETTIETFSIHQPTRYIHNMSPWGPHHMSSTENEPETVCIYTIGAAGCAVASEAVIAQDFTGITIDPDDVNDTVVNACRFSPTRFETAYASVDYITSIANPNTISWNATFHTYKDIAFSLIDEIESGKLLIIRANLTTASNSSGHYEVAYGYKKTTEHYTEIDIVYYDLLMIDSSLSNDKLLSTFLIRYPQPKSVYRFADKTP